MNNKETRLNGYGETHVSLEVAKKLKEIGFNWWCRSAYTVYSDGSDEIYNDFHVNNVESDLSNNNFNLYGRPEQTVVLKWFRDIDNVYFDMLPIFKTDSPVRKIIGYKIYRNSSYIKDSLGDSYEEVLEKLLGYYCDYKLGIHSKDNLYSKEN